MIKATIYQNPDDVILRCILSGHAEYADKGEDIVCSAVSMLFINTINSIEVLTKDKLLVKNDAQKNRYDVSFVEQPSHDAQLLMQSLQLGLSSISAKYGKQFLKIILKEVQ
jgi:uncharacterized protein YsxB (DUF464 family)